MEKRGVFVKSAFVLRNDVENRGCFHWGSKMIDNSYFVCTSK